MMSLAVISCTYLQLLLLQMQLMLRLYWQQRLQLLHFPLQTSMCDLRMLIQHHGTCVSLATCLKAKCSGNGKAVYPANNMEPSVVLCSL